MPVKGYIKQVLNKRNRRVSSRKIRTERHGGPKYMGTRKNPKHSKRQLPELQVVAPSAITLSNTKYHAKLVEFVSDLEKSIKRAANKEHVVNICFRNTRFINAAGGIYLLARVDVLVKQYPHVNFTIRKPPKVPHKEIKAAKSIVHDVLCQIGFYRLLRLNPIKGPSLPHVDCWQVNAAEQVESELLGEAISKLEPLGVNVALLYRAGIEAMSNAAEHAYSAAVKNGKTYNDKRWWLFSAVLNNELIVYICDLGHGIPETLPYTQSENVLKQALDRLVTNLPDSVKRVIGKMNGDALQIAVSTLIKETRTELAYRGKGGKDIKSFIDANPEAQVQIYSNKGYWEYKNTRSKSSSSEMGIGYNNRLSIGGTIVGWSVPLKAAS